MATKYSFQQIADIQDRKIFFDANVLIYIFWSSGAYAWERSYASVFGGLLKQGNDLVVDFIVISEVINRVHHLEYQKHLTLNHISSRNFSYKQYRNSIIGKNALAGIYLGVEADILNKFTIVGKSFNKNDIESYLTVEPLDFSDKGILSICKENGFVLLTNDIDFKTSDIDILSSNPAM